jgi:hypothetical protein
MHESLIYQLLPKPHFLWRTMLRNPGVKLTRVPPKAPCVCRGGYYRRDTISSGSVLNRWVNLCKICTLRHADPISPGATDRECLKIQLKTLYV